MYIYLDITLGLRTANIRYPSLERTLFAQTEQPGVAPHNGVSANFEMHTANALGGGSIAKHQEDRIQAANPAATQGDGWLDQRLEGKQLMSLKNASLRELVAGKTSRQGPSCMP